MTDLRIPVSSGDHIRGSANAPITLVEYGDYECPFCGSAHAVVEGLREAFNTELRFVFRHFPLVNLHPNAESAAETAEFAGAHGRFWPMHDALFEQQKWLSPALLFTLARALRLSSIELRYVLETGKYLPKVRNDYLGGVSSGVNGTPTFFINSKRHNGPFDFDALSSAILGQLRQPMVPERIKIPVRPDNLRS
jgi:protein-disulfide isomerase